MRLAWMDSSPVLAPQGESLVFLGIDCRRTPIAFEMEHGSYIFGHREWAWNENRIP